MKKFLVLAMALCMVFTLGFAFAEAAETPAETPVYDQTEHDTVCVEENGITEEDWEACTNPDPDHNLAATCETKGLKCWLCPLCKKCVAKEEIPATGHDWVDVAKKEATCAEDGYEAYAYCANTLDKDGKPTEFAVKNDKGEYEKVDGITVLPKLNHMKDGVLQKVPAGDWDPDTLVCEQEYSLDAKCALCDEILTEKIDIVIEHKFEDVKEVPADCENDGTKAYKACTRVVNGVACTKVEFEGKQYASVNDAELAKLLKIEKLGHNLVAVNGTPGKCEEAATSDHMACDREGCDYTEGLLELPAPGHKYTIFLAEVAPTCTEEGLEAAWKCEVCGQLAAVVADANGNPTVGEKIADRVVIDALGHAWKTVLGKYATCTEEGVAAHRVCERCDLVQFNGSEYAQEIGQELVVIPAHKHADEDGYEPNTVASPDRKGDKSLLLVQADMIKLGKITLGENEKPERVDAKPTCTETGYVATKWCPWCYEVRVEGKEIPANGHTWELTTKGTMPTCMETGISDEYTCKICGATDGGEVIAPLGHALQYVEGKMADCLNNGNVEFSYCTRESCVYGVNDTIYYIVESGAGFGKTAGTCELVKDEDGNIVLPADVVIVAFAHGEAVVDGEKIYYENGVNPFIKEIAAVAPTCTKTGIEGDGTYCEMCNAIIDKPTVIDVIPHNYVEVEAVAPNCLNKGNVAYKYCDMCGLLILIDEDGKETTSTETVTITKKDDGTVEYKVPAVVEIAALGHNEVPGTAVPPTCTEDGKTAGTYCDRCGMAMQGQETDPAKGHSWIDYAEVAPKCVEEGVVAYRICPVCKRFEFTTYDETYEFFGACEVVDGVLTIPAGAKEFMAIPALGHEYNDYVAKVEPTCWEDGHDEGLRCGRCTPNYADGKNDAWLIYPSVIETTGHPAEYITFVEGVDPCCDEMDDEDRYYSFCYCTKCSYGWLVSNPELDTAFVAPFQVTINEDGTVVIPEEAKWEQLEHTWTPYFDRAPTCTENGVTTARQCKVCEYKEAETFRPATGHSYVTVPGKAATCTEDGVKDGQKCSVCGDEIKGEVIPATGHNMIHVDAKAPTCTEDGHEDGKICANGCGERDGAKILEKLGHDTEGVEWTVVTDEDGTSMKIKRCKRCGEVAEIKPINTAGEGLLGDVDHNGRVNLTDAVCIMNYYVGNTTEIDEELADFNKDGAINLFDALAIVNYWTGA